MTWVRVSTEAQRVAAADALREMWANLHRLGDRDMATWRAAIRANAAKRKAAAASSNPIRRETV